MLQMAPADYKSWPTLGPAIIEWMERHLVHGPGDLLGEPLRLGADHKALISRMYEVYPHNHPQAGRRRFRRVMVGLPKGSAKTELAALLVAAELSRSAPVRVVDWDGAQPIGGPVKSPFIPILATTVEQSDQLMFFALRTILDHSSVAREFNIGIEQITTTDGSGRAISLAGSPSARDGALMSFVAMDETHHFDSPRLIQAHKILMMGLPKRKAADPWMLETTTAFSPGAGSVAEDAYDYGQRIMRGEVLDPQFLFFWRSARDGYDLNDPVQVMEAVKEAAGPAAAWRDNGAIAAQFQDPTADRALLSRLWLNQLVRASDRAFDMTAWERLADPDYIPMPAAPITVGFDGSKWSDATALVATELATGYQWLAGLWERPPNASDDWSVPLHEVEAVIDDLFRTYRVWRMYADPYFYEADIANWAGRYGTQRVVEFHTNRLRPMAYAVSSYHSAILGGALLHSGQVEFSAHVGNSFRKLLKIKDEDGKPLWTIYKEAAHSPNKIDAAMAGVLSWEARNDAIAAGVSVGGSVYERRALEVA